MDWRVRWRPRVRQLGIHGSSPMTKQRSGNHPVRSLLRLRGISQAAMHYYLLWGADRKILVPDAKRRARALDDCAFGLAHYS